MELVEEKKVSIPVSVLGNMLLIAARGFKEEDPHNVVEMDVEEFTFLSRLVTRGVLHVGEGPVKTWTVDELTHFWMEVNGDSDPAPVPS